MYEYHRKGSKVSLYRTHSCLFVCQCLMYDLDCAYAQFETRKPHHDDEKLASQFPLFFKSSEYFLP